MKDCKPIKTELTKALDEIRLLEHLANACLMTAPMALDVARVKRGELTILDASECTETCEQVFVDALTYLEFWLNVAPYCYDRNTYNEYTACLRQVLEEENERNG